MTAFGTFNFELSLIFFFGSSCFFLGVPHVGGT